MSLSKITFSNSVWRNAPASKFYDSAFSFYVPFIIDTNFASFHQSKMKPIKIKILDPHFKNVSRIAVWTRDSCLVGYCLKPAIPYIQSAILERRDIELRIKKGLFSFKFHLIRQSQPTLLQYRLPRFKTSWKFFPLGKKILISKIIYLFS